MVRLAMVAGSSGHNGVLGEISGTMYMGHPYNGGDYYQPEPFYLPAEMCPAHPQLCIHGDFGPVTVPMVSTNPSPPIAMPVQVPPGHVVQQIVDESGTLRHVILSTQPPHAAHPHGHSHGGHIHGGHHHLQHGPHAGHFVPGSSSNQQSFFPPAAIPPPGYHASHFHHAPLPPPGGHIGPHGGPPPGAHTHGPHSPPPSLGYHKDERTQRQYVKLKRKLDQKRIDGIGINSGQSTPGLSPRKELVNGLRRGAARDRGMSSVGTSEDGEESSSVQDDEDDAQIITEILSSVQGPQVMEITSRSALLLWTKPVSNGELFENLLRYEVLLSDKGKEGKYKSIYSGTFMSCRIQDLKPGQEYSVCLQAHQEEHQGSASEPTVFRTPPCEPEAPSPPKLISRSRTSLQLRWNAALDNGSHILHYLLEYDEGKGGEFVELSKGKGKQFSVPKLQQATSYKFRLAAVNECGKGSYSDIVSFSTSGSPPTQPNPPILSNASVTSLHLMWQKRPNDEDFTLQMDDHFTKHGYLPVFNGKENEYLCNNLRRNTEFKFRLKAHNEEGASRWSDEVTFKTLPDKPSAPGKPFVKGKIHAHSFKVKWEPPNDRGGAAITSYTLEMNTRSGFESIYTASDTETVCDRLQPGTTYQLRVSCISAGGQSPYSDMATITTEAVCPGPCAVPRPLGKPKATAASIKWMPPNYDGGAPILEYEVELLLETNRRLAFKGKETECTIQELLPGQNYGLTVRALNRIGAGVWSEKLNLTSGAAPPNTPDAPTITIKTPFNIYVEWEAPQSNGSSITEYRLETSNIDENGSFVLLYQGALNYYDAKNLSPFTPYYFRLAALNNAGCSPYSSISATMTPAATPASVQIPIFEATPTQILLSWTEPADHGSNILYYNIEVGDKTYVTEGPVLEHVLENLDPETVYRIKIQAINSIGAGSFSSILKASTLPLPPEPPKLECVGIGHNYLKLKWGEGKNSDFTQYYIEMFNQRSRDYQCVYQGTAFTCKVNKLQELTKYSFRICAANDFGGQGDFSEDIEFITGTAPPSGLKAPKVVEVHLKSVSIEWTSCKQVGDPVIYSVQCSKAREQDFKEVYRGSETKHVVEALDAGCEYHVRVLPIRLTATGDLLGPASPVLCVATISPEPSNSPKSAAPHTPMKSRKQGLLTYLNLRSDRNPLTDQQWALVILFGFIFFAILVAVLVEQFINWRKAV